MFKIEFSTKAKKEFDRLEERYKKHTVYVLRVLSIDPVPTRYCDVKKLVGLRDTFRIRIGKIRIVYVIDWKNKVIIIARIAFRKKVYRN